MGAVLWVAAAALDALVRPPTAACWCAPAALAVLVGAGLLVYAVAVLATGALDMRQLRGFLQPPHAAAWPAVSRAGLARAAAPRHNPRRSPKELQ